MERNKIFFVIGLAFFLIKCTEENNEESTHNQTPINGTNDTTMVVVNEPPSDSIIRLIVKTERTVGSYRSFLQRVDPSHPRFLIRMNKSWSDQQEFIKKDLSFFSITNELIPFQDSNSLLAQLILLDSLESRIYKELGHIVR